MHDIEPYYRWREYYISSEDDKSPFYGMMYDEFTFSKKIYNYFIHPQWDEFGSVTLYLKVIFVDYQDRIALIELIGEWNDALKNDIMFLKREIIDNMQKHDVNKFILFCDNVLNYHGDDDSYYEEWYEDVSEEQGWICLVNLQDHVQKEMEQTNVQYFAQMGPAFNNIEWRRKTPKITIDYIVKLMSENTKQLRY